MQIPGFTLIKNGINKNFCYEMIYKKENDTSEKLFHLHVGATGGSACDLTMGSPEYYVDLGEYFEDADWKTAIDNTETEFKFLGPTILNIAKKICKDGETYTVEEIFDPQQVINKFYNDINLNFHNSSLELSYKINEICGKFLKSLEYGTYMDSNFIIRLSYKNQTPTQETLDKFILNEDFIRNATPSLNGAAKLLFHLYNYDRVQFGKQKISETANTQQTSFGIANLLTKFREKIFPPAQTTNEEKKESAITNQKTI